MVNPQPVAATVSVSGFLRGAFVLHNRGKSVGLANHILDVSVDNQALYVVRSQQGDVIMPK